MTKQQLQALLATVDVIGEAIQAMGEVPDGVLYSRLMGQMSLSTYQGIIRILVEAGKVERKGDVLCWITVPCE
jgi:hypothetical protein